MNNAINISILLLLSFFPSSCSEINQKQQRISNSKSLSDHTGTAQVPGGIVRTVKKDRKGSIWIASWKGVFRYNGKSFSNITAEVSTARFFAVLEDKKGNFWLSSLGSGVYYYDGKSFRNFTTKDGLSSDSVNWIMEDRTGKVWFGTADYACVYVDKTYTILMYEGKPFKNVRSIIEDKNGNIWLGGNDGLWRYDNTTFTNYSRQFIGYIYEDKNGNIWTSSDSIVNRDFKHASQPPTQTKSWMLSRYNSKSLSDPSMSPDIIRSGEAMIFGITEANDGSIWFGTLNGVHRYNGNSFTNFKTK
ncbi:ligand-binding sensor domain-containing protein [Sphingobacterium siyangense]|uniref:ligand-binding sensor domain-containing protein n=1 Tax=Sphingobacterium siyangense TaxID=459529 RepID=UPI003DA38BE1